MRGNLNDFIKWLTTAEYGDYDDEEETKQEELPKEAAVETEADRQKKLIAEQLAKQQETAEALKSKQEIAVEEETTKDDDIAKMEVEDDFNIDDI